MIYERSWFAVGIFLAFVGVTLGISFYYGSKAKSAQGYFAAHGQIHWFVNGIAFAGDYLSAASFLGICGMIAFYGYDGFLYSIGYLAGWIVALFVIAEPMKRLGKFTFADALDATFQSRGIKLVAGISTLAVSIFYLIPQMVGAGALIVPLLDFPHWVGVVIVGATVILIVVSAGMVSTTYVQFLKGSLLVFFSLLLTWMVLQRGFKAEQGGNDGYKFLKLGPYAAGTVEQDLLQAPELAGSELLAATGPWEKLPFVRVSQNGLTRVFSRHGLDGDQVELREAQTVTTGVPNGPLVNGLPKGSVKGEPELHPVGYLESLPNDVSETGPLGPLSFFRTLQGSRAVLWGRRSSKKTTM